MEQFNIGDRFEILQHLYVHPWFWGKRGTIESELHSCYGSQQHHIDLDCQPGQPFTAPPHVLKKLEPPKEEGLGWGVIEKLTGWKPKRDVVETESKAEQPPA